MYKIYTKDNCSFCTSAKELLKEKEIEFEEVKIKTEYDVIHLKTNVLKLTLNDKITMPRIFKDDQLIGGYQELKELLI